MSRTTITLYELDRAALQRLSAEVEALLAADDREGLADLLELDDEARMQIARVDRAVDLFLRPERAPEIAALFSALRRVSKKRALSARFTSDDPALEGRLRAFDAIREDRVAAGAIDKLLSPKRLPWYLRVSGATCGWIDDAQRRELVLRLEPLRATLTAELRAFADGLRQIDGDVIAHDAL